MCTCEHALRRTGDDPPLLHKTVEHDGQDDVEEEVDPDERKYDKVQRNVRLEPGGGGL